MRPLMLCSRECFVCLSVICVAGCVYMCICIVDVSLCAYWEYKLKFTIVGPGTWSCVILDLGNRI